MQIQVKVHGLLAIRVDDPDGLVSLTLPDGTDVAGVLAVFRESSSFFDPRTCLALIDGQRVGLERVLEDGEGLQWAVSPFEWQCARCKSNSVWRAQVGSLCDLVSRIRCPG
jgi:hypothetical protein